MPTTTNGACIDYINTMLRCHSLLQAARLRELQNIEEAAAAAKAAEAAR